MKTLREAKIGETVKVVKLHGEGAIKRRIMDMGITKGTEVYVRKVAPLGDPVEVTVRGYELSLRADVTQIYLYILRCWEAQHVPLLSRIRDMGQTEFVKHAIAYVQAHYADLTAVETADACGVSATYFSRMFKRAMHQSFSDYVTLVRLRHAEQLLLLTDDSVTEVAQAVGFSTASYFISRFRAAKKMTPLQFRQAAKSTAAKGDAPCPENGT